MLHIRCGDDIREAFGASGIAGEFVRWADPLCQGPTPAGLTGEDWQQQRAGYLADRFGQPVAATGRYLAEQQANLDRWSEHEETVLWFEHDLFDQVILVYLLDWFAARTLGGHVLSLICIGDHAAVRPFRGLGQLDRDQLAALLPERRPVTAAQLDLGRRAWAAFRDPDPRAIEGLLRGDTSPLPFLADALRRHLQDFPGTGTGLARTQQLILEAVSQGASDPVEAFLAVQELEAAPWLGDSMFWPWLAELAEAAVPALAIDAPPDWPSYAPDLRGVDVHLTRDGHRLFYGELDWIAANGIDRWLGGVHLQGVEAAWRWDERAGRLVPA
ncbi:MAG: DUF1835 domain-containing protein [Alphaproteobacteria bacterium]|nr:DUF1835 domain-containing protein [Alphaproteobacteria bacterium]